MLVISAGLLACLDDPPRPSNAPPGGPAAPPGAPAQDSQPARDNPDSPQDDPASSALRIISFPPGRRSQLLDEQELSSLVTPWRDRSTGHTRWVLSITPKVERGLREEGLGIEPFVRPEEYEQWDGDRQLAWNYTAKKCLLAPVDTASAFPSVNRLHPSGAPVSPYTTTPLAPYESYYLPYSGSSGVPSLNTRASYFKLYTVANAATNTLSLSPDFLGGYPWDSSAPIKNVGPASSPVPLVYFELGWKSAGTFQGRPHQGPRSLIFIGANQHAREMVTFEVAWRLVQRLAYAYGKGKSLSSHTQSSTFWQDAFDAGLHVLIVPTINPWGYQEMTRDNGIWETNPLNQAGWRRGNANNVDLNRNWPMHWLQGGTDGREGWGNGTGPIGQNSYGLPAAGRKPASEPEVVAVMNVLQSAIGRLHPNVSAAQAQQRFPVVGLDLHSSAGMVMKSTYLSPYEQTSTSEAYLCGVTSDCINPDEPVQSAIFGNNNRPGVIGRTGLATGGNPDDLQDDPDLPYYHGRNTANIYSSSGKMTSILASKTWLIDNVARGMPAATIEMTANQTNRPFGFGTCAPPKEATEAIDQVVLDMIPVVERMAQGALSPANLPDKGTGLPLPPPTVSSGRPTATPFPETESIANLGVRYEASAESKTWSVSPSSPCPDDDDDFCHEGACSSASGDLCSGTWWSSYPHADSTNARALKKHWMFAVRLPDPASTIAAESVATDADAQICTVTPGTLCTSFSSLVLLRRGSLYNLYGLPLALDQSPPSRVVVRRRVRTGSTFTNRESSIFVAATIPSSSALSYTALDPLAPGVNELVLSSLLLPDERMRDVRVDLAISQEHLHSTGAVLSVTWPFYSTSPPGRRIVRLEPVQLDFGARQATGTTYPTWVQPSTTRIYERKHIYTYDFDLIRAVWEQSQGYFDTDGTGFALAWNSAIADANVRPPVLSARVFTGRSGQSASVEPGAPSREQP